jgi:hypothetical protein
MSYFKPTGAIDMECDPEELGERFCDLYLRKGAEFQAAEAEGITPAQWYKDRGITPAGKTIKKGLMGMSMNNTMILGGAALVGFLIIRKKT